MSISPEARHYAEYVIATLDEPSLRDLTIQLGNYLRTVNHRRQMAEIVAQRKVRPTGPLVSLPRPPQAIRTAPPEGQLRLIDVAVFAAWAGPLGAVLGLLAYAGRVG